jgi:UDP-N-acetylmuramoyl-L-alanyl-D-glutamate--2,6-diaminopimelate ligase
MWQNTKNLYHLSRAVGANILYGFPARKMKIIGVTGTDGKTTTSSMLYHILRVAGYKAGLISTVSAIIDGQAYDTGFHVTNPDSLALQSYLKKAYQKGVEYLVLEVTSHGLDQHRVYGIPFEIGVLTNITNEHLDYHKTYENYVRVKSKLFQMSKIAILNKDDKSFKLVKQYLPNKTILTYGLGKDTDNNLENLPLKLNLLGDFNLLNALAAAAAAKQLGIKETTIRKALLSYTAPEGREQIVYDKEFTIIIDFAHTPNSFAKILPDVKKMTKNRLIHVFGAAAKRDTFKRPEMGKYSSQYADIIILTAEDPRDEPIEHIFNDIEKGIQPKFAKKNIYKIPNRKEAIEFAISLAEKGDIVITTGKGHEKSINYGHGEEPWNEHEVVAAALRKKKNR